MALALPAAASPVDVRGIELCLGDERKPQACVTLPGDPEPISVASIAAQRVADSEAGTVRPVPVPLVPVESIADKLAADAMWLGVASAADLYTTSWALRECPTCFESNPAGPDAEARIALKAAAYPLSMGIVYYLRRRGNDSMANGFRWGLVAVQLALAVNNSVHAVRGR